jgi:hypothetical protein
MNQTRQASSRAPGIACVVCQTHSRPVYVPWHQHAVGCPVRAVELQRRQLELRTPLRVASNIAAF